MLLSLSIRASAIPHIIPVWGKDQLAFGSRSFDDGLAAVAHPLLVHGQQVEGCAKNEFGPWRNA
jgi:hypothetical protein